MALTINQLYLLKGLEIAGKIECKTKFQKLIFLAQTEERALTTYKFEKYHYGPFSFDLSDDIEALSKTGFVREEVVGYGSSSGKLMIKHTFSLTPDGKKELQVSEHNLDKTGVQAISSSVKKWNSAQLDKVLKYVYGKYMNDNNRELAVAK